MGELINGNIISECVKQEVRERISEITASGKRAPKLVVVVVGNDPRSAAYVRNKKKSCEEVGIEFVEKHFEENVSQDEIISYLGKCNQDDEIDGVIVQLPVPKHLNEEEVTEAVRADKDVDGLTRENIVRLYNKEKGLVPATPSGIMRMLKHIGCDVAGKHVVIVGRGKLVGHPLMLLMLNNNATVTVCHSRTENLKEITRTADVLVVGIGKAKFINSEYVKEGAVVIDAGINVNEEGKLVGDCDYQEMLDKVSYITPVPRGVGPMTVAMLLVNVLSAYENRNQR